MTDADVARELMPELDHEVYVLTLNRKGRACPPGKPEDIVGQRFYLTPDEARAAIAGSGYSHNDLQIFGVDLRRPWTIGMPPLI